MAEILLFHHAQGRTAGVLAFADELRRAGHTVLTPDLFDGRLFDSVHRGVTYAQLIGFDKIIDRGVRAADGLPNDVVYAGFSLGVMPAQKLAQTRPGARGALFFDSCVPVSYFGGKWPPEVPLQIHAMDADPSFIDEGDIEAAKNIVATAPHAELFLYPGNKHLFADNSLPSYDPVAAEILRQRVMDFLKVVDTARAGISQA
jgi:dienelactone hydrolase